VFRIMLFLTAGCCLAAVGCGSVGDPCSATGGVSFAGEDVADGSMRFFPVEGTPGVGAGAKISQGKYDIPQDAGLVAGSYRVSITATRSTGRQIPNPEPMPGESKMIAEVVQYIPEQYNMRTTLLVELQPGDNQKDFALTGR
jgi:hypothetical protein